MSLWTSRTDAWPRAPQTHALGLRLVAGGRPDGDRAGSVGRRAGRRRGSGSGASRRRSAFLRASARAIAHGQRDQAEALARARGDRDQAGSAVRARLAADRGDFDAAAALAAPASAAAPTGEAALEWGLILLQQGKKVEARRVLAPVASGSRSVTTADGLLRVARAARALGQVRTANSLFRETVAAAAKDPALLACRELGVGRVVPRHPRPGQRRGLVPRGARRRRRMGPGPRRAREGPGQRESARRCGGRAGARSRSIRRSPTRISFSPARPSTPTRPPRRRNT